MKKSNLIDLEGVVPYCECGEAMDITEFDDVIGGKDITGVALMCDCGQTVKFYPVDHNPL